MMHKLNNTLQRILFAVVVTLIVAAYPASASAAIADIGGESAQTVTAQPVAAPADEETTTGQAPTPKMPSATTINDVSDTSSVVANQPTAPTTTATSATATVSNDTTAIAQSGNATVVGNTTGGNATSGSATVSNTTINALQSTSGFNGTGGLTSFTTDIDGDHVGDILLDPATLTGLHAADTAASPTNLAVHTQQTNQIINTVTLNARTGSATVSGNGVGGNATTGDANAVANIINLIHSTIGADHTFIGMININGALDGDILLPGSSLQALPAPQPNVATGNLDATTVSDQTITNNVSTSATSGEAAVTDNQHAGSATTGQANTNVTLLNLTGRQIVGKNSLVVFVNVLGHWVGFIVDAPAGATTAALGDDITGQRATTDNALVRGNSVSTIHNTVDIQASSGDATVASNGVAGNATSGKATASANILNVAHDSFSLGGWFGVLFINVFGVWHGSFGVDTAAGTIPGDSPAIGSGSPPHEQTAEQNSDADDSQQADVLAAQADANNQTGSIGTNNPGSDSGNHTDVLGASTANDQTPTVHTSNANWRFAAAGIGCSLLLLLTSSLLDKRKARLDTTNTN